MKVIKKSELTDGTKIQIEDWSNDYSFHAFCDTIAAYPKNKFGETFRVDCRFNNETECEKAFNSLKNGTVTLYDFDFCFMENGKKIEYWHHDYAPLKYRNK